jgi:hypothetical protein
MKIVFLVTFFVVLLSPLRDFYTLAAVRPKTVSFFRASGYYTKFKLKINKDFNYSETNTTKGNGALRFFITNYTSSKEYVNVTLSINNRDTCFKYFIHDKDSLMISLGWNNAFVILNQREYVWGYD